MIHCEQDITWMDRECLAALGCKFEYASQCNDVLRDRIVVQSNDEMRGRFLEEDRFRLQSL